MAGARYELLSSGWSDAGQLDGRLSQTLSAPQDVALHFSQDSKLTVGACVRLLAFVEAYHRLGLKVELHDLAPGGLGGYLDRIGLFEHLSANATIVGLTPAGLAEERRGQHDGLVEIVRVPVTGTFDKSVANRLAERLAACAAPEAREQLGMMGFTFFAELLDNIRNHSGSPTPGYAALQVYTPHRGARRMVEVVVADAGEGILSTLRPALQGKQMALGKLDDPTLLLHAVNTGVSRNGEGAGCGIYKSADHLRRLAPQLELRVPQMRLKFEPGPAQTYVITQERKGGAVYSLPGTHWVARYALD